MERSRRRFWTRATTVLAVLVIIAATISGLFQLAVQAVPGYRTDIEHYVQQLTGQPVRIGTLDLTWRYTWPSLDLGRVALLDAEGGVLLEAERLRIGFSLARLVRRDFAPNRLELHGLALDVVISEEGRVELPAWPADGESSSAPDFAPLAKFDQLRLERCRINLHDQRPGAGRGRDQPWSFGLAYAELARGLLGNALEAEVVLPAELGASARIAAQLQGDLLDMATWEGDWSADVAGVNAGTWLASYLAPGASVSAEALAVRASGKLEGGAARTLELDIDSGPVQATRAPHTVGFQSLQATVQASFSDDSWEAHVTRFELDGPEGASPQTRIHVVGSDDGETRRWEGAAEQIRLADFAPWLRVLQAPDELLALDRLSGLVDKLSFRVADIAGVSRYQARLDFSQLALPAADRAVGAAGLSGELAVDESGGRVVLRPAPARLQLPGKIEGGEVAVDLLEGEAQWRRSGKDWAVEAPRFRWQAHGTEGQGSLKLLLPAAAGRSPELELDATFSSRDVTLAKSLMPRHWSRGLRTWLDRAILAGNVPRGRLKIAGPLADYPYTNKPGTWELDIQARGIALAFSPDWPQISEIAADLEFRGNGLAIKCSGGSLGGNPIHSALARIPDFSAPTLVVEGRTGGEAARYFEYLLASPMREPLGGLLSNRARGPVSVDVRLDVPLHGDGRRTRVSGTATAEGVELQHPGLAEPFREIRGRVAFDGTEARSDDLSGRWYGLPLLVSIQPQADGSNLLRTGLGFRVDPEGRGPSALIPEWLRKVAAGEMSWRAALRFGGNSQGAPLTLQSDLSGVELRLPPPLGKAAADAAPMDLTVGSAPGAPLRITVDYRGRLGADLRLDTRGGNTRIKAAALRLGGGVPAEVRGTGIQLGGSATELDARAWYEALDGMGLGDAGVPLAGAEVQVGRLSWNEFAVRDTSYRWQRDGRGWLLGVGGAGASGEVRYSPQRTGRLTAQLDLLVLEMGEGNDEQRPPADPSQWPVADVEIGRLRLNQADLGRMQLASERIDNGQRLRQLSLAGGSTAVAGNGEWRRSGKGKSAVSSGSLSLELATSDIAGLLRAFRYAPNLDAKNGRVKASLLWEPAAAGLDWRQARGPVSVAFENGQLRAVEPGAGRVLGLVNFYALPRRLTLNFRDVLSSGLGFDKISGDFALAGGDAVTDNLEIVGPSLRMETRGRIGLAARDYDQQVTVYPDVSAGVTLGALALGGPVIGVLALIAQEILDKPLDQVTQLSYRLTGSWDNPQVERVAAPASKSTDSPPPKSGKP